MDEDPIGKQKSPRKGARVFICPICDAKSSDYIFHKPTPDELLKLRSLTQLKDKKNLDFIDRRGICERHWDIDLNLPRDKRPVRFPSKRPELRAEGKQWLPVIPSRPMRDASPKRKRKKAKGERKHHRRGQLEASLRAKDTTIAELKSALAEKDRTITALKATLNERDLNIALLNKTLKSALSWSVESLHNRNFLPLLTGDQSLKKRPHVRRDPSTL